MNKICMLVVTFNRKELVLRNIQAVMTQSIPVDCFVFDNHSSDGTEKFLRDNGIIPNQSIHYFYSEENLGGAGGFSQGMKYVYELGYEYAWLMDDDGYCWDKDTLARMVEKTKYIPDAFILNSTVICDDKKHLTFGFLNIDSYKKLEDAAIDGLYKGYINPFNSTLISRKCIDIIGFPKGEFFIYGDEHEYMLRAIKNDIFVATVIDSLYFHPINRKTKTKRIWKYDVPMKEEPIWKTYCDTRNSVYIMKNYYGYKMVLVRIFVALCGALLKRKRKVQYFYYTVLAIFDALRNDFSRPIMFSK